MIGGKMSDLYSVRISEKRARLFDKKGWLCHRCIQCVGIEKDGSGVCCFAEPDQDEPEFVGGVRRPIPIWECKDFLGVE